MGELQNQVSPKKFLEVANMWYLPGLAGPAMNILTQMKERFHFPKVQE